MNNINDSYFDGQYKDIWKAVIPMQLTELEVNFLIEHFNLTNESNMLDLMCGFGRHALGVGRNGTNVTAVDNLLAYIEDIKITAEAERLPIKTVHADIVNYQPTEKFDLVICMGNSLNFFSYPEIKNILSNITPHIREGGHLLINTWTIGEIVFKDFKEKTWAQVGDMKVLSDAKCYFNPTRIETATTMINKFNEVENKIAIDYIFSLNEFETILDDFSLKVQNVSSVPGKKDFKIGDSRAYIVAKKEMA